MLATVIIYLGLVLISIIFDIPFSNRWLGTIGMGISFLPMCICALLATKKVRHSIAIILRILICIVMYCVFSGMVFTIIDLLDMV